ncbi:hypothetical protein PsYK624_117130 [Phanerochaete sordida]|uniref:Uncharacterized protein n=1 Tax=Phanerochaete sordida TaxID=48140 RepID=A0A9P3GIG9_9APHY|nr:hypothetical protein PsYK624_117130 [Phanerochaete sordida]
MGNGTLRAQALGPLQHIVTCPPVDITLIVGRTPSGLVRVSNRGVLVTLASYLITETQVSQKRARRSRCVPRQLCWLAQACSLAKTSSQPSLVNEAASYNTRLQALVVLNLSRRGSIVFEGPPVFLGG